MEKNKITIRLCYIELIIFAGILVTMISHFRCGFGKSFLALMIIAALAGCGVSLALKDYLKSMIQSSAFDVAGVHNKKALEIVVPDMPINESTKNILDDFKSETENINIEVWYVIAK